MSIFDILITAIALSMDAFAVSICKGMAVKNLKIKHMLICGLWFGVFQALMPLIGYLAGSLLSDYIKTIDHWIAFLLLSGIGINMIREAFEKTDPNKDASEKKDADFSFLNMLFLAVATSIDALTVGVSMAFLDGTNILLAVCSIGIITFALSALGVKIGKSFGLLFKSKAEMIGGIILILIGLKVLLEHLGIIV